MSKIEWRLLQLERMLARLQKVWHGKSNASKQRHVHDRMSEYRDMWCAVTNLLHDELKKITESAAASLRSQLFGVRLVTEDPAVAVTESNGTTTEQNTTPGWQRDSDLQHEKYPELALRVSKTLSLR